MLPSGSARKPNASVSDTPAVLLNEDAWNWNECDSYPLDAVAGCPGGSWNDPRKMELPFTSSVSAGVVVPMPTRPADSKIVELPSTELDVHIGMKSVVPLPVGVTCGMPDGASDTLAACGVATIVVLAPVKVRIADFALVAARLCVVT